MASQSPTGVVVSGVDTTDWCRAVARDVDFRFRKCAYGWGVGVTRAGPTKPHAVATEPRATENALSFMERGFVCTNLPQISCGCARLAAPKVGSVPPCFVSFFRGKPGGRAKRKHPTRGKLCGRSPLCFPPTFHRVTSPTLVCLCSYQQSMAWRASLSRNVRELRFCCCNVSQSGAPVRYV